MRYQDERIVSRVRFENDPAAEERNLSSRDSLPIGSVAMCQPEPPKANKNVPRRRNNAGGPTSLH
jgi:hypothetical protein